MNSEAKDLLVSKRAAFWEGPKIFKPSSWTISTKPFSKEFSGPTTIKSMSLLCASFTIVFTSFVATGKFSPISPVPVLPCAKSNSRPET